MDKEELIDDAFNEMESVVNENYEHYSQFKGIPTCDIGDVYEWIELAKNRLKKRLSG